MSDELRHQGRPVPCDEPGCGKFIKSHRWAKIKAADEGWFFGREGSVYCPDHLPAWVPAWRARQQSYTVPKEGS